MILLRLVAWPYVRRHLLRTTLTMAGIALGVMVFVGMHLANRAVLAGFADTVDRIAGKSQLQITAGDAGLDEGLLATVQSSPAVRIAVPVVEVVVDAPMTGEGSLLILGVDMMGDRSLRTYDFEGQDDDAIDDPLVFLAQPDSVMLSKPFADRHGLTVGSQIALGTSGGTKRFTVRGLLGAGGLASAFGGNLAVMDIYAAQHMFGRGRTFDRIDIALAEGTTLDEGQHRLQAIVGAGFDVQPPAGRGRQFESMLASNSMMVAISSTFALFIGMFIIYNAFAIAVTERRTEIGILRAIGATHGQIRWIFLGESAIVGGAGSLAGVIAGSGVAGLIAKGMSALIGDVYRIDQAIDNVALSPGLLLLAFATGTMTSVFAAAIPAATAARQDPVQALQKGRQDVLSAGEGRLRVAMAAALGVTSATCLALDTGTRVVFYGGYAAAMGAALLLSPMLTMGLARCARPVLQWLRPVEGALAADSLLQAPRRTSASVTALMFSLALAVAFQGMGLANYRSLTNWMDSVLNPELFIMPSQRLDVRSARFPAEMAETIASVPGVARVQSVRNSRTTFRGAPVMLVALDMASVAETVTLAPVAEDPRGMYDMAARGAGLVVSDNLATLQHISVGDMLEIDAPHGLVRLPVSGVLVDYSEQQGAILMDHSVFHQYWRDTSVNVFRVYTEPGTNTADVRQAILTRFSDSQQVFVLTNSDLKAHINKLLDQWFRLTSVQVAIAVLVAILGVVNTLTVSITDRRRELGIFRAIGGLHWQVRRTIWIEAVTVAAVGLVLGTALGAINLFYLLEIVQRDLTGFRLDYVFPTATVVWLIPSIAGAALVAALWPAESAVRGSIVEALEYE